MAVFKKSATILDMGCGTSSFVDDAREAGWSNMIGGVVRHDAALDLGLMVAFTGPYNTVS